MDEPLFQETRISEPYLLAHYFWRQKAAELSGVADGYAASKVRWSMPGNSPTMLSRFLGRASSSHSTLTPLVNSKIMTPSLGPDFYQRLTARLFLSIRDRVLRVFGGLAIQLGYDVPSS